MRVLVFAVCAAMTGICGCVSQWTATKEYTPPESDRWGPRLLEVRTRDGQRDYIADYDTSGMAETGIELATVHRKMPVVTSLVKDKEEIDRVLAQAPVGEPAEKAKRLIVYTASFMLGVYDRDASAKKVIELAQKAGGYVSSQTNETVVVRVPAEKFKEITEALPSIGRVIQKNIEASDITEQYTDLELRLSAKRKYLESLQRLLSMAQDAKTMLEIQKEVGAVIEEIDALEGKLRYLADRVAYSTIAVALRPATWEAYRAFRLPFDWIESLGIEHLVVVGGGAR